MKRCVLFVAFLCTMISAELLGYYYPDSLAPVLVKQLNHIGETFSPSCGHEKAIGDASHRKTCSVARRFYNFAAWSVWGGKEDERILSDLEKRDATFFDTTRYHVAPATTERAGVVGSSAEVTVYVSSACGRCKQVVPPLKDLAQTAMKGTMVVSLKPLYQRLGDVALLAADMQGKMWDLFEVYGNVSERLDENTLPECLETTQIDTTQFWQDIERESARFDEILAANYAESKVNGMMFIPHILVSGKLYDSEQHPLWIYDYIEWTLENK